MKKNFKNFKKKVVPLVLSGPNVWNGWVHGFSPRFYESPSGEHHALNPGMENLHGGSVEHRDAYLFSLGIENKNLFLMKQVHGDSIFEVTKTIDDDIPTSAPEADAVITRVPDQPVGVMTADCVPVLIFDPVQKAVAAVHAGRKGTALRILGKTVYRMQERFGSRADDLFVLAGPAIGGCCYEVDDACVQPFREVFSSVDQFIFPGESGAFMLDLIKANQLDAESAGVRKENIKLSGECTACHLDRWYSYRKEGETGRMVAVAMLKNT